MQVVKHALCEAQGSQSTWDAIQEETRVIADAVAATYEITYSIDFHGNLRWNTADDIKTEEKCNEMFHEMWRESIVISEIYE